MSSFYTLDQFALWLRSEKQDKVGFPSYLGASENFYNLNWTGEKRIKNVGMILDVVPSADSISEYNKSSSSTEVDIEEHSNYWLQALTDLVLTFPNDRFKAALLGVIKSVFDSGRVNRGPEKPWVPEDDEISAEIDRLVASSPFSQIQMGQLLRSPKLRAAQSGRYFFAITLAEAETIRRIIHLRSEKPIVDGGSAFLSLRTLSGFNDVLDQSVGFLPPPEFQLQTAHQSFRFFDGELFYTKHQLLLLVHALHQSRVFERQVFFENIIARKRRSKLEWSETPLRDVFLSQSELILAFPESLKTVLSLKVSSSPRSNDLETIDEIFISFSSTQNTLLNSADVFDMFHCLGFDLKPTEVATFIQAVDVNGDNLVSLGEFQDFLGLNDSTIFNQCAAEHLRYSDANKIMSDEIQRLNRWKIERDHNVKTLRESQQRRLGITASACTENPDEIDKNNPEMTHSRARWNFTSGKRPSECFRLVHGCLDFFPDSDALQTSSYTPNRQSELTFMRLEANSVLELKIPHLQGFTDANQGYTITMCIRFPKISVSGLPIFSLGESTVICAESGKIYLQGRSFDSDESDESDILMKIGDSNSEAELVSFKADSEALSRAKSKVKPFF